VEYYHASRKKFSIGEEVISGELSPYYPNASDVLDSCRPKDAPARKTSLYTSDSIEFAFYFLKKERVCLNNINLYKVDVKDPWRAVFSIPHAIETRIAEGREVNTLIAEYWSPTQDWNFFEYLSRSFIVSEKLPHPEISDPEMLFLAMSDSNLIDTIG
jgi:hypothetical protein